MKGTHLFISAFLFIFAAFGVANAEETKKADPREKLETAVPEAIRLLEKKEYIELLKKFVSPDELKEITKQTKIEDFAKEFGKDKAEQLLKALKATKDVKPKLDDDMKIAVFEFKEEVDGRDSIKFKKVDKYWYIKN